MTEDENTRYEKLKGMFIHSFAKIGIMEAQLLNGGGTLVGKPHRHHDGVQDFRNIQAEAESLALAVIRDERQ